MSEDAAAKSGMTQLCSARGVRWWVEIVVIARKAGIGLRFLGVVAQSEWSGGIGAA